MLESGSSLAIVIPAYKAQFLASTLTSLASQTDQRFGLYIGDDASPEPIEKITRGFSFRSTQLVYHRFEENLGSRSLTAQWQRCVALSHEPWIWLFSDDDVMELGCVSAFYQALERTRSDYDVYHFNTVYIDSRDALTEILPPHPDWESWKTFTYFFLRGLRFSTAQELVFSRKAYERIGGFVDLPLAWGTDQATLMALAGEKGIGHIPGPRVRFRMSGQNISSTRDRRLDLLKIDAARQLCLWIFQQIERVPDPHFELDDEVLRNELLVWFKQHLAILHTWLTPAQCMRLAQFIKENWGKSFSASLARMAKLDALMVRYTLERILK
jgi:glycosyltransferase involved in cell wall biosynthesis